MKNIEHVIWDGDNTIWGWMEYAVPAYEAMCREIASIAGKNEDVVAEAMKSFYTSVETLEHEGLMQGLNQAGFFEDVEGFDLKQAIVRVQRVFSRVRHKKLSVYPGIAKTMRAIRDKGINQLMLTDAPGGQAFARLKRSRLSGYMSGVYAMPTAEIEGIPDTFRRHFSGKSAEKIHVLPEEKPHVDLEAILGITREKIADTVAIIGDNRAKDMALAQMYDCLGIHANYGVVRPEFGKRIARFAPPRVASRSMEVDSGGIEKNRIKTVDSANEILPALFG